MFSLIQFHKGDDIIAFSGMILKGRYCILDRIGGGGEGSLYLARDMELGVLRAVKELPGSEKKEAKLLRLLDHPSIPAMVDYAETADFCYLIMEYIKGKSLEVLLEERRQFTVEEILRIGKSILRVLAYLHSRKPPVYYGDLKPSNLIFTGTGDLYLVDLGSAVLDYGVSEYICKGTPGYAAPEQTQGLISAASDLYALGKTLLRLSGDKRWTYYLRYPSFAEFIFRCCRKDPQKRWRSAGEAEHALKKIRPLKTRAAGLVLLGFTALSALLTVFGMYAHSHRQQLPIGHVLGTVTAMYYQPLFRSGSPSVQKSIEENVENALIRLRGTYTSRRDQELLRDLMDANSRILYDTSRSASLKNTAASLLKKRMITGDIVKVGYEEEYTDWEEAAPPEETFVQEAPASSAASDSSGGYSGAWVEENSAANTANSGSVAAPETSIFAAEPASTSTDQDGSAPDQTSILTETVIPTATSIPGPTETPTCTPTPTPVLTPTPIPMPTSTLVPPHHDRKDTDASAENSEYERLSLYYWTQHYNGLGKAIRLPAACFSDILSVRANGQELPRTRQGSVALVELPDEPCEIQAIFLKNTARHVIMNPSVI